MKPVRMRHSAGGWSAPAEGPSHSTDQPGGKVHGQVRLANRSSKLVPEKQCHKARLSILKLSKTDPSLDIT